MTQLIFAAVLALVLTGYAFGRRIGLAEGRERGRDELLIDLRQRAYESGDCPVCQAPAQAGALHPSCYN